jgi:hypothetical protein
MNPLNYIDEIAAQIGSRCGMDFGDAESRRLLRIYAVLALARGVATTKEDVHDAWSAWRSETRADHPSLIPFASLDVAVQDLDEKYRAAIVEVAVGLAERGAPEVSGNVKAAFEKIYDAIENADGRSPSGPLMLRAIDELADQIDQAGMIIAEGARFRERLVELLDLVAVTLMGPPKPGQRHQLGDLPRAAAELRERVPVGIVGVKVNGHDAGRQAELAALRIAVVQRDRRIAALEQGLRAACEQRDGYRARLEAPGEGAST